MRAVECFGQQLVPVFFVTAGLSVTTDGATGWAWVTLALVVLLAAELAGGYAGARAGRLSTGQALRFGVPMNTRGLTEIAVLQAGVSAKILTPRLFFFLVLMALLATAATGPLLVDLRYPPSEVPPLPTCEELSHEQV